MAEKWGWDRPEKESLAVILGSLRSSPRHGLRFLEDLLL
jgi:hypothetical protein